MFAEEKIEMLWEYLVEKENVGEDTLHIITDINGYKLQVLEDVLYVKTGYRTLDQLLESEIE